MTDEGRPYPFLFYGVAPSDWFDPEAGEFAYELQFCAPLSASARSPRRPIFTRPL